MVKGQNFNHPQKGSDITVEPIRSLKDVQKIKNLLKDRPRDLCLFTLGTNTNLRASDLINIRVGQVKNIRAGDELTLTEKKTGKKRRITLNAACVDSIQSLLKSKPMKDPQFLLSGLRGKLTTPSVTRLVKSWCDAIHLKGNYGSHTLRKTFGYHQRVTFQRGIAELMHVFNHSNQRQTLSYLCIQPEEIREIYMNEI